jgi:hypothetical protein
MFANHALKAIESFSHIRWPGAKENARRGGESRKHQRSPRPAALSSPAALIAAWSKPGSIEPVSRRAHPLVSSISNWVPVPGLTINTGTKAAAVHMAMGLADRDDPDVESIV